ncbi:phosphodiester glycosidase family protein [Paenibacillus turpanensis]|uniref:phosphodiester glycosidase family protein n=1 Tax=Paenibacillus turpanensis TaxID=2689078 RepID=UPI0014090896|nr:phosphodiester glycosidase family protein [Paenibacillus turpanensis]
MNLTVKQVNRYFLLLTAPFFGVLMFAAAAADWTVTIPEPSSVSLPAAAPSAAAGPLNSSLEQATGNASAIGESMNGVLEAYQKSGNELKGLQDQVTQLSLVPSQILDARTTALLGGNPIRTLSSPNIDLKLFEIVEPTYRGHALKVTLKSDSAMKMVLGKDKLGSSETTLSAVSRYGAAAGVNAGGFADEPRTGKRFPLSTTMLDGKYVYGFEPTFEDLFFVGLNKKRELIGGKFSKQEDLDKLEPVFGATFVPILLRNGMREEIPSMWLTSPRRAPRTVIANYKNDQLLFLVTDGYDENGNSGATLPELQDKLISLGVMDAYNLDGGGSSSLIWGQDIINRPSDGKLRPLATHFLFFE